MIHLPEPILHPWTRKPLLYSYVTEVLGTVASPTIQNSFYNPAQRIGAPPKSDFEAEGVFGTFSPPNPPTGIRYVRNSHPLSTAPTPRAFSTLNDFIHMVPLGINAETFRVRPLRGVIYYLVRRKASVAGDYKLFRRELRPGAKPQLLAERVKKVEFSRTNLAVPSVSTRITYERRQ
jgi:hypothetical protein